MGSIVRFPGPRRPGRDEAPRQGAEAQILFFTGVRYVRHEETFGDVAGRREKPARRKSRSPNRPTTPGKKRA